MNKDVVKNEKKCFARPEKFGLRLLLTVLGVTVQGFGLSWLVRLELGADPFTNFMVGCDKILPTGFGTTQLIMNLIMFIYVILYGRNMIGFGTIANMVFLGYIIDFFNWIWDGVLPADLFAARWMAYLVLIPAFACLILGAATYMSAGLGTSPYDGIPFIVSEQLKKPFKYCRMVWDIVFMIVGFLLGGGFGVVTLLVAFFAGPIINGVKRQVDKLLA